MPFARPQVENAAAVVNAPPQPYAAIFYQRENAFVGDGADWSEYHETFAIVHKLGDIFAEQTERRISHNNVGFAENFNALRRAEIAVAGERAGLDAARRL